MFQIHLALQGSNNVSLWTLPRNLKEEILARASLAPWPLARPAVTARHSVLSPLAGPRRCSPGAAIPRWASSCLSSSSASSARHPASLPSCKTSRGSLRPTELGTVSNMARVGSFGSEPVFQPCPYYLPHVPIYLMSRIAAAILNYFYSLFFFCAFKAFCMLSSTARMPLP